MDAGDAAAARARFISTPSRAPRKTSTCIPISRIFWNPLARFKEALAQWQTLQQLMPSYFLPYFQEGRLLERQGDLAAARSSFAQALALHPGMAAAWYELSNIDASQGRFDSALKEVDRAARLEPAQGVFHACAGKLLSKMNRHQDAIARYRQAIEVQPDYLDGHISLGAELAADGKIADAKKEFQSRCAWTPPTNRPRRRFWASMEIMPRLTPRAARIKENSPICASAAETVRAVESGRRITSTIPKANKDLPRTITVTTASTRKGCRTRIMGSKSMPTATKNKTPKASCKGCKSVAAR
jgi:tetratricopeptide (TPR) repeat protein